jgi:hypothetical protein
MKGHNETLMEGEANYFFYNRGGARGGILLLFCFILHLENDDGLLHLSRFTGRVSMMRLCCLFHGFGSWITEGLSFTCLS